VLGPLSLEEVCLSDAVNNSLLCVHVYVCSGTAGSVDSSSLGSYKAVNTAPVPVRKDRSPLFRFKTNWWRDILWKDRVTVAYLTYHTVTEILTRCNNIAEQNHNHRTLENLFRLD
jgi:hypothetical protein